MSKRNPTTFTLLFRRFSKTVPLLPHGGAVRLYHNKENELLNLKRRFKRKAHDVFGFDTGFCLLLLCSSLHGCSL